MAAQNDTKWGAHCSPHCFVLEIASSLERGNDGHRRAAIERQIREASVRLFPIDVALMQRALETCAELHLCTLDALYVALAEQLHVPLYTWDDEVVRRAAARIRVYKPQ